MGKRRSDIDPLKTYEKDASAIQEFDNIGSLPMRLNMVFLDKGKGIAPTRLDNQAKWHKNFRKLDKEIYKSQIIYLRKVVFSVIKVLEKFTWFLP